MVIQRADVLGITIPDDPDKVTDAVFQRLIALCGGHVRVVGVGHCFRLTNSCLDNMFRCYGLQFLDLSYTQITDISPIKDLPMLRSLNIAGLKCANYDDIKWITTLEILNLNFSTISSVESLSGLLLLRSLDLGHTPIVSITDISTLTRLEELYVDSTLKIDQACVPDAAKMMKEYVCMKYLQIGNSALTKGLNTMARVLPPTAAIITKPRR
jgi:hypothetical protein